MPTVVEMPDGTELEFPDGMEQDAMAGAAAKYWQENGASEVALPAGFPGGGAGGSGAVAGQCVEGGGPCVQGAGVGGSGRAVRAVHEPAVGLRA
jgi:hypothetical protein